MASTFQQLSPGVSIYEDMIYSRYTNPTRSSLEECLASIENAKYCLTFGSGAGAVSSISYLLKAGDHVVMLVNTVQKCTSLRSRFLKMFNK